MISQSMRQAVISQLEAMGYQVIRYSGGAILIEPVLSEVHFSVTPGTGEPLPQQPGTGAAPVYSTPELCPAFIHVFGYPVLCRVLRGHGEAHQGIVTREGNRYLVGWDDRENLFTVKEVSNDDNYHNEGR